MKQTLKKVINYVMLAFLIVPCAFFLAACGDNNDDNTTGGIAGTTWSLSGVSATWTEGITAEQKATILADALSGQDGISGTDDDITTEAEYLAYMEDMMSSDLEDMDVSIEISATTNRAFMVTEGFDLVIINNVNDDEQYIDSDNEVYLNSICYIVDRTAGTVTEKDGETSYIINNNQFTINDIIYTISNEPDNTAGLAYYSYNKTTNTVSLYEDAAMTIAQTGYDDNAFVFTVSENTIRYSMVGSLEDGGVTITMTFTKA